MGFDAPQLFSLPPWAKAGIAMANIINAITNATVTTKSMRLIMRYPLSVKGVADEPRQLANAPTLARGDEFPMNSWPTSQNSVNAKFAEFTFHALR